jgi:hypothetical protein
MARPAGRQHSPFWTEVLPFTITTTQPFKHHFALAFLIHSAHKIVKSCQSGHLKTNVTYEKGPKAVPSACPLLASWGQFVLCLASLPISRSDAAHNPAAMRPRLVWRYGGLPTNTSCHALHQLQNSGNGLGYYGVCSPPLPNSLASQDLR